MHVICYKRDWFAVTLRNSHRFYRISTLRTDCTYLHINNASISSIRIASYWRKIFWITDYFSCSPNLSINKRWNSFFICHLTKFCRMLTMFHLRNSGFLKVSRWKDQLQSCCQTSCHSFNYHRIVSNSCDWKYPRMLFCHVRTRKTAVPV